jgi:Ca-activated chloride channel homolog
MGQKMVRSLRRRLDGSVACFAALFGVTLIALAMHGSDGVAHPRGLPSRSLPVGERPSLTARLSQHTVVQGESTTLYATFSLTAPPLPLIDRRAADTIVILDKSGSMAAENRLPYAKQALHRLIERMTPDDRLSIVAFDSHASLLLPLTYVTPAERERIHTLVDTLAPGSGTNMSSGLEAAKAILHSGERSRPQKVLLLSDGEANEGITSSSGLSEIVLSMNRRQASVSTIGMGLGFNESLMASLADWGGGSFSYLERLEALTSILDRNLQDARAMFSPSSSLELTLGEGVTITDAGGYPINRDGARITVPLGALTAGAEKRVTVTLGMSSRSTGSQTIADARLLYGPEAERVVVKLTDSPLLVSVVEPARRDESLASIDKAVLSDSWTKNNVGAMQRSVHQKIAQGDVAAARRAIDDFRDKLKAAESAAAAPLASPELHTQLGAMEADLSEAETGGTEERKEKQNRLSKRFLDESISRQRGTK